MKIVCLTLTAALLFAQQSPELELKAAMHKEQVQGDLKGAIASYQKFVEQHAKNRALVAKALLQMAECHQKLGDAESRKIYERIVREYADQNEAVAAARTRLGSTAGALTARLLLSDYKLRTDLDNVTADGRLGAGADWSNGDLIMRDMASGEIRRLLTGSLQLRASGSLAEGRYVSWAVISPDQRQVAFARYGDPANPRQGHLWVISTEPGAKPRQVTHSPDLRNVAAKAWSADGTSILARIEREGGNTYQIAWISMADGSAKVLKSFTWDQRPGYGLMLSPDGRYIVYPAAPPDNPQQSHIYVLATDGSTQTTVIASAGINETPVWTPDGGHLLFTSNRTGRFDLWSVAMREGKPAGEPVVARPNIGKIGSLGMTRSGTLLYSTGNTVETISVASLSPAPRVQESFVGISPTLSPNGTQIVFTRRRTANEDQRYQQRPSPSDSVDLVLRTLDTGEERVFTHDGLMGIPPVWFHDGRNLLLLMVPREGGMRSLYRLNLPTGEFQRLLEFDPRILSAAYAAISPDDKTLYLAAPDPKLGRPNRILAYDLATGEQRNILILPDENSVNGPIQLSPDGRTLALYAVNKNERRIVCFATDGSGYRELFKDHAGALAGLAWHGNSRLLFHHNPAGETWQLMSVSINGGTPESVGLTSNSAPQNVALSADGTRLAWSTSHRLPELWALDNVLSVLK